MKVLKQTVVLMTLLVIATNAFSQIKVTVKDSITAKPMGYATVELLNSKDSSLIAGITDEKGFISLPVKPNMAKIRVSFLGYKTHVALVTSSDVIVSLTEDAAQLSEVSVTGSNRTVKIDRDSYVITKDL